MSAVKAINPKVLARNERIRKQYAKYTEQKRLASDYALELLEEEFLPLTIGTIWLIITQTGFYKNY
ncbi:hypothetical protein QWY81_17810 [Polaribacter undariae]|uniref:Uncharacterized protein n=1 Tax=Polaribacter sejongensis TaxID=985043 RepID=A0AAJ1VHY5_9FLAO|nr:hypothetical protein [Polaribacter undariae]MDN3621328.1 hypothetical protein [Polaribacter undariae]UWD31870.1 hypothetical protein NQP51_17275 [Polaribacter undariae]